MDKTRSVILLGIFYFIILGCYSGGTTLINYLYDAIGFRGLGQQNIALTYAGFFIFNFSAAPMTAAFREVKLAIFIGFLFYGLMMMAGLFTYYCYQINDLDGVCSAYVIKAVNYTANFLLGAFGATLVWTGQYMFIDKISVKSEKKRLIAYFYMTFGFSDLFGNAFNYLYYSFDVSTLTYFIIFSSCICAADLFLLMTVPGIADYDPSLEKDKPCTVNSIVEFDSLPAIEQPKSTRESINAFMRLFSRNKIRAIIPYMAQSGVFQGYMTGAVYKVVVNLTPTNDGDSNKVKRHISLFMIVYALLGSICSKALGSNKTKKHSNSIMKLNSLMFTLVAAFLTMLPNYITSIWIVIACAFPLAIANVSYNVLVSVYMAENFKGQIESFLVFKQFQNIFTTIFMVCVVWMDSNVFNIWLTATNGVLCLLTIIFLPKDETIDTE